MSPTRSDGASSAVSNAWNTACRWLGYRPRTESEIRKRLLQAGYSETVVTEAIRRLTEYRYLDDRRLAEALVEEQKRRGIFGRAVLRQRLRGRGIDAALADEVVGEALQGVDELEEALALAGKRMKALAGLDRDVSRRRLAGYLSRRGFSMETVYKVLEKL